MCKQYTRVRDALTTIFPRGNCPQRSAIGTRRRMRTNSPHGNGPESPPDSHPGGEREPPDVPFSRRQPLRLHPEYITSRHLARHTPLPLVHRVRERTHVSPIPFSPVPPRRTGTKPTCRARLTPSVRHQRSRSPPLATSRRRPIARYIRRRTTRDSEGTPMPQDLCDRGSLRPIPSVNCTVSQRSN